MGRDLKRDSDDEVDPINSLIAKGNESSLLSWLRSNVHGYGRQLNAEELVEKVSGRPLSSEPFIQYLGLKLEELQSCS